MHAAAKVICRLRALELKGDLTFVDLQIMRRATTLLAADVALVEDIPLEQAENRLATRLAPDKSGSPETAFATAD